MNMEAKQAILLKLIDSYKKADSHAAYADIMTELAKIRKSKRAAYQRIIAQKKAGDTTTAARSRKAYDFCCKYEKQLENIIDGHRHRNSRQYFTKDSENRYRNRTE